MGTKVDLERLATTLDEYTYAYLMTTGENGRPHAVAVRTELVDGRVHVDGLGWRSRANVQRQHIVALVYPPSLAGGYSLIVDGEGAADGDALVIVPTVAVLHRPPSADGPPPGSACLSDCQRLEHE